MRLVFPLFAGLAAGAAIRLLWPLTDRLIEAAEKPSPARRSAADRAAMRRADPDRPSGAPGANSRSPEIAALLRDLDLVPLKAGVRAEPSWLYVNPSLATLLRSEAFVEASITVAEAAVDEQCAPLFVQLALPPEREDQLRRVLAEMVFARNEITTLAGVDPKKPTPAQVQEIRATSDEQHRQRIAALLGPEGFARFESYFDTLPARADLRDAFLRVAALAGPLTPVQRDALVAAHHAAQAGGPPPRDPATVLSPAQQAVFSQWQIDHVAQRKVQDLLGHPPATRVTALYTRAPSPRSTPAP